MTQIVDALDREVFAHKYDLANQTLWTDHIDSGVKTVVYDLMGRPTEMKDAKGSHILNSYDDLNRPIRLWAADDSSQSLTLRNLAIFGDDTTNGPTDPKTTNHLGMPYKSYDEAGLVEITAYDFKGAPLEKKQKVIKDSLLTSTTAYTVDWPTLSDVNFQTNSDNLLEHKAHTGDSATDGYITSTEYDGIGRPTKITYPKDVNDFRRELKPQYNKSGALCKVDFDGTEYVKEIAYDAKGQRLLLALGNGIMTRYAYSEHNFRLLRMCTEKYGYSYSASTKEHTYAYDSGSDERRQDLAYLYDLGGNIKSIKTDLDDSGYTENYGGTTVANDDELTRKYKYDAINRLIEAIGREAKTHGAGNVWNQPTKTTSPVNASGMRQYKRTYDYDKMGNIQELQHTSGSNAFTRNFNYRTGLNQLSTIDNGATPTPTVYTTYTHDANGNQTKLNSERFLEWGAADQLKFFKIDDGSTISKWSQYRYSGGQRVKKVYNVDGGNYTTTVYIDGIFEYQYLKRGGSTYERNYCHVMDDSKRIAQVRYGSAVEDITDSTFYIVDDHLGTSTLRLNTSGSLIDRQEYYPFGESSLRTFDYKRYQYTGKERDEESGLYYYGARYYSAWTCRFLGVDPMASQTFYQGSYVYADNNPIMMNDPTGMVSEGGSAESAPEKNGSSSSSTTTNLPNQGNQKAELHELSNGKPQGDKVKDGEGPLAYAIRNDIPGETNLDKLDNLAEMNPEKFRNYDLSWSDSEKANYWDNLSGENWMIHPDDQLSIGKKVSPIKVTGPDELEFEEGGEVKVDFSSGDYVSDAVNLLTLIDERRGQGGYSMASDVIDYTWILDNTGGLRSLKPFYQGGMTFGGSYISRDENRPIVALPNNETLLLNDWTIYLASNLRWEKYYNDNDEFKIRFYTKDGAPNLKGFVRFQVRGRADGGLNEHLAFTIKYNLEDRKQYIQFKEALKLLGAPQPKEYGAYR